MPLYIVVVIHFFVMTIFYDQRFFQAFRYLLRYFLDIGLEIRTHKQDVYYTFYDIDGNGTKELIIAGGENAFFVMTIFYDQRFFQAFRYLLRYFLLNLYPIQFCCQRNLIV